MEEIKELAKILRESNNIVFFGGAGDRDICIENNLYRKDLL